MRVVNSAPQNATCLEVTEAACSVAILSRSVCENASSPDGNRTLSRFSGLSRAG
jgi:hypothetical protein